MLNKIIFGARMKALRQSLKLTQSALGNAINVTKTQISDIESGKTSTTLDKAYILADYFDVSIDYLVGRSDDPKRY